MTSRRALVLDFGGPVLVTPFERLRAAEAAYDLPAKTFDWTGPFDPAADPLWQDMQAGRITEPAYWERRAEEFDAQTGGGDLRALIKVMYDGAGSDEQTLLRPSAVQAVHRCRAAGIKVGILTNDLAAFHTAEWVARMRVLADVDALVDAGVDGVRKPDPAAYRLIADRLGVAPADAVFVDDQPVNIAGAAQAGMPAVFFDVSDPAGAYREALATLGLG